MNPAHIVYQVLTDRDWGMGYPTSMIDTAAFTAAADQLFVEGLGLCLLWNRQDTIENFLQTVMDHAGAVLVQSRTTGLMQMNLIRGGYDVSTLLHLTADDVVEIISYESPSITGTANEVVVNWFDPAIKATQTVTVQALGAIQAQGVTVSQTKDYPGLATQKLAARIAQRDLRATSIPLKRLKVKLNRKAYSLLPGGLFVLSFPSYGIDTMIFRVGDVDYGSLTDGAITITAVQDVFSLPETSFVDDSPSYWVRPDGSPKPASYLQGFEVTYRDLYRTLSRSDFNALDPASGYAAMVAAKPSSLSMSYNLSSKVGAVPYVDRGTFSFCPTGELVSPNYIGPYDTSIIISNGIDLDLVGTLPQAALLGDEIVKVTALDTTTGHATIVRGCIDTLPDYHPSVSGGINSGRIWFYESFSAADRQEYVTGELVNLRAATTATGGNLDPAAAPVAFVNIVERWSFPYPPADPRINGVSVVSVSSVRGAFTFSWSERNRITQMDQVIGTFDSTVAAEAGTTYNVRVYNNITDALISNNTGITTTSIILDPPGTSTSMIRIELESQRSGLVSFQHWNIVLARQFGYGTNYGYDYGSI
jgi:hypothetical protein